MAKEKTDLIYGTLDMLILKALQHEPRHGLGIADRIHQISANELRVEQGSLYPALYRLERKGWIEAEWGLSDTKRQVKLYSLTSEGRARLAIETEQWSRFADGVSRILGQPTPRAGRGRA